MRNLIFGLGALLLAGIACAQPQCNPNELMACFRPFSNLHFDVVHDFNVTDMQTACGDWSLARQCVDNFIGGPCHNTLPEQLTSVMRALESVGDYMCGEALPEILKEHECFFTSHSTAATCQEHLGLEVTQALNPQEMFRSLSTKGGCGRLSRYEVCVITTIRKHCSAKASDVIRHVYGLINRELLNILGCGKPILSQPQPLVPTEPEKKTEDAAIVPTDPENTEATSCHSLNECLRSFEGPQHKDPSERCRLFKKIEHCLRKALVECKSGRGHIEEFLRRIRITERHYHCERHHSHMDSKPAQEHQGQHNLDRGTIIAICVGVAAIVLVLVTVLVAVCLVKRRRRSQQLDKSQLVDKETYKTIGEATK